MYQKWFLQGAVSHLSPSKKKNLTYYFLKELSASGEDIKLKWPHSVYWILTTKKNAKSSNTTPWSLILQSWVLEAITDKFEVTETWRSRAPETLKPFHHLKNPLLSIDTWKRFKAGRSSAELDPPHSEDRGTHPGPHWAPSPTSSKKGSMESHGKASEVRNCGSGFKKTSTSILRLSGDYLTNAMISWKTNQKSITLYIIWL